MKQAFVCCLLLLLTACHQKLVVAPVVPALPVIPQVTLVLPLISEPSPPASHVVDPRWYDNDQICYQDPIWRWWYCADVQVIRWFLKSLKGA